MEKKFLSGLLIVVVLTVFAVLRRGEASKDVKGEMKFVLSGLPVYAKNATYIDGLFEAAHSSAFQHSYKMGSNRRPEKFDENQYMYEVLTHMMERCRRDKENDIGNALLELRNSTTTPPEKTSGQ